MNVIGPFAKKTQRIFRFKNCCDWIIFIQVPWFEYSRTVMLPILEREQKPRFYASRLQLRGGLK